MRFMKDMNIFNSVKLSQEGFKLLFQNDLYENNIEDIISANLKTIVVDPLTKRFSAVSDDFFPFNSLEYYEEKQELEEQKRESDKTKKLKKVVNY